MNEVDFNLLDEPWIIVANAQGQEETLTLTETLVRSHELASISGEMTAQDISITRLLLGVLYTIYTRTDEYKEAQDYNNGDMCTEIWKNMWKRGHFPENEITEYLEAYRDRFWLIHPGRPFYQVASLETLDKSHFITSKMIGDIVESANKTPLFSSRTGRGKQKLLYPEAARWLIHLNSFDDAALKKTKLDYDHDSNSWKATTRDFESIGPGWLGQLGLVYAMGNNLFETLMLNFTLRQSSQEPWESGKAAWELETPRSSERTSIVMPTSGEELFTLQSRRIYLKRVDGVVVGFVIIGGDHFSKEDAFNEPMTMWRLKKDKQKDSYFPKTEQSTSKQFWRDFAPLMAKTDGSRKPCILKWLDTLRSKRAIPSRHVRICTLNIIYGKNVCGIKEVWSDAISINTTILSELGDNWQVGISELLNSQVASGKSILEPMCPAYAGMLPLEICLYVNEVNVPRIRGDAPETRNS